MTTSMLTDDDDDDDDVACSELTRLRKCITSFALSHIIPYVLSSTAIALLATNTAASHSDPHVLPAKPASPQ